MRRMLLFPLLFLVPVLSVQAQESHAIAMHGAPKYTAGFTHLDYVNPDAPKGGLLREGVIGTFDSLHAQALKGNRAAGLHFLYDRLMARVWDEPFSLYGLVAETIEVPDDRSWVAFTLRKEARFHDGQPITVEDVIFTFETLRDKGRPNSRQAYGKVKAVQRMGTNGIKFLFEEGVDREAALVVAMMPVLPKQYWEGKDFTKTTLKPPLGSGPYRIKTLEAGRSITYERVKNYWAKDLPVNIGQYNFDEIRYDYYRDDGIALQAFEAGSYDLRREWAAEKWAKSYDFPAVRRGDVKVENLPHARPEWMRALIFNTRRPFFQDRRVRKALTYAFDFEWMNKTLFHNAYKRINSYYPNSELAATGYADGVEKEILLKWKDHVPDAVFGAAFVPPTTNGGRRANLRMAKTLLKEAGWNVQNNQLVHHKTGQVFSFQMILNNPSDEKLALSYADSLKRLGITMQVRTMDTAQYRGILNDFDFDMTLNRWISSLSPGVEQQFYWGSLAADQNGSRNYAGIKNPAIDAVTKAIADAVDRKTLLAYTHALDRILTHDYYAIPLYYLGHDQVAYWSALHRPETTPLYGMVLESWWATTP